MAHKVENDWTIGKYRCVVIMTYMGHRCGYVGLPKSHPLHGAEYGEATSILSASWQRAKHGATGKRGVIPLFCAAISSDAENATPELVFDVHGGITYSGDSKTYPVKNTGRWWYGFDAGHCDDAKDLNAIDNPQLRETYSRLQEYGTIRTLEYMMSECASLVKQLKEIP